MAKGKKTGSLTTTVALDRRAGEKSERRKQDAPVMVERRVKVQRRRQIDPTTCEREYTDAEIEFMQAMDAYKRKNGRMFPTCSEILEVIRDLGYIQVNKPTLAIEAAQFEEATAE